MFRNDSRVLGRPAFRFASPLIPLLLLAVACGGKIKKENFPDEASKVICPQMEECTLGEFLVNAVLKALTAYRMQFFLYAKAAGAEELSTADCWIGKSAPPPA